MAAHGLAVVGQREVVRHGQRLVGQPDHDQPPAPGQQRHGLLTHRPDAGEVEGDVQPRTAGQRANHVRQLGVGRVDRDVGRQPSARSRAAGSGSTAITGVAPMSRRSCTACAPSSPTPQTATAALPGRGRHDGDGRPRRGDGVGDGARLLERQAVGDRGNHRARRGQRELRVPTARSRPRACGRCRTGPPPRPAARPGPPRAQPVTPKPRASMTSATSWPSVTVSPFRWRGVRVPSARCTSDRHTPAARTATRTCPGPGSGHRHLLHAHLSGRDVEPGGEHLGHGHLRSMDVRAEADDSVEASAMSLPVKMHTAF